MAALPMVRAYDVPFAKLLMELQVQNWSAKPFLSFGSMSNKTQARPGDLLESSEQQVNTSGHSCHVCLSKDQHRTTRN